MFRLMNFEESNDVNQFGLYLFFFNLDRKMPIFGSFSCQDSIIHLLKANPFLGYFLKIILQCYMFRLMNFEESNDVNQFGLYFFFFFFLISIVKCRYLDVFLVRTQ